MAENAGKRVLPAPSETGKPRQTGVHRRKLYGRSLRIFGKNSPIRRCTLIVTEHRVFNAVIFALTIASCLLIATTQPFAPPTDTWTISNIINAIIVGAFGVECLLRIITLGLVCGPRTYLRDPLYVIDVVVFLAGLVDLIPGVSSARISALRVLRVFRVLRALKFKPAQGMQALILSLVRGFPLILHVLAVLAFFLSFFAIIGLETMSSSMRRRCVWISDGSLYEPPGPETVTWCNLDNSIKNGLKCPLINPGLTCQDIGYNSDIAALLNFDNIWYALFSVFQVTSLENWSFFAYGMMDAELTPVVAYFIMIILVCNFLVMNMTISVVCSVASSAWEAESEAVATVEGRTRATPPTAVTTLPGPTDFRRIRDACLWCWSGCWQKPHWLKCSERARGVQQSKLFKPLFLLLVLCNAAILGYQSPTIGQQGAHYRLSFLALDVLFTSAFTFELVVNVATDGHHYFASPLNCFDCAIVCMGLVSLPFSATFLIVGEEALSGSQVASVKLLRTLNVFRVVRVLRVLFKVPSMRHILESAMRSSQHVVHIVFLSIIASVTYALIGQSVFAGQIAGTPEWLYHKYGTYNLATANLTAADVLDINAATANLADVRMNFDTFTSSLLTLFIVSSSEQWNQALVNALTSPSSVRWFAPIFVISWFMISNFLLLQLFVAAILQQLEMAKEERLMEQQAKFVTAWKQIAATRGKSPRTRYKRATAASSTSFYAPNELAQDLPANGAAESSRIEYSETEGKFHVVPMVGEEPASPRLQADKPASNPIETAYSFLEATSKPAVDPTVPSAASVMVPKPWLRAGDPLHDFDVIMNSALPRLPVASPRHHVFAEGLDASLVQTAGKASQAQRHSRVAVSPSYGFSRELPPRIERNEDFQSIVHAMQKKAQMPLHEESTFIDAKSFLQNPSSTDGKPNQLSAASAADATAGAIAGEFSHLVDELPPPPPEAGRLAQHGSTYAQALRQALSRAFSLPLGSDLALGYFGPRSVVRKFCRSIEDAAWFSWLMAGAILASAIVLGLEDYAAMLEGRSWFRVADIVFTAIFLGEMAIKILADGFMYTPHAYLRSGWNWFDAFVAVMSLLEVTVSVRYGAGANISAWGRFIRLGRTLRPLKLLERFKATRVLLAALWSSKWELLNAFLIIGTVFYAFSVAGRDLFGQRMGACTDAAVPYRRNCVGTVEDADTGAITLRRWVIPYSNFDTIGNAASTLFEVSTVVSWVQVMWRTMDIAADDSRDSGPFYNQSTANSWFFVVFIFVCGYIILKVFVGIILVHLARVKGTAALTDAQKQWSAVRLFILSFAPSVETDTMRKINQEAAKTWISALEQRSRNQKRNLTRVAGTAQTASPTDSNPIDTRTSEHSTKPPRGRSSSVGVKPAARRSSIVSGPKTRRSSLVQIREQAVARNLLYEDEFEASAQAQMLAGRLNTDLRQLRRAQYDVSIETLRRWSIFAFLKDILAMRKFLLMQMFTQEAAPRGFTHVSPEVSETINPMSLKSPIRVSGIFPLAPGPHDLISSAAAVAIVGEKLQDMRAQQNDQPSPQRHALPTGKCCRMSKSCITYASCVWCCRSQLNGCADCKVRGTKACCTRFFAAFCVSVQTILCSCWLGRSAPGWQVPNRVAAMDRMTSALGWRRSTGCCNSVLWWQRISRACFDTVAPCNESASACAYQKVRRWHAVHSRFELLMLIIIAINIVFLMTVHSPASTDFQIFWSVSNIVFLIIFSVELILKLAAHGFRGYLADTWNAFDAFLVVFGWVMTYAQVPGGIQIARVLRVARVIRVLRQAPSLRVVFTTTVVSLFSLANTTLVVVLFMYVFAIVGMELYGPINANRASPALWSQAWPDAVSAFNLTMDTPSNSSVLIDAQVFAHDNAPYDGINRHAHFRTVGTAMLTLFRVLTGENWPDLYHDTWRSSGWAPVFWVGYNLFVVFILSNFYLASVLEHFETTSALESGEVTYSDLVRFKDIWKEFDPDDSGFIPLTLMRTFLLRYSKSGRWSSQYNQHDAARLREVMSYYDAQSNLTSGPRKSAHTPRRKAMAASISIGPVDPIAAYEETEREVESAVKKKLKIAKEEDEEGRTPFLAYISKGLYSREWYGLVRAEIRSLSLRTFVQRFMIEHRRDYKYASMLFEGFSSAAQADAPSASIDQLSQRERLYVTRLRADAFAAASNLPDMQIPVPFGKLLVTLCKWKLGSGVLSAEERLFRELRLSQYYSDMMAARVQALIKGYLLRRRVRFQRTRAAIALVQRWWRYKRAQHMLADARVTTVAAAVMQTAPLGIASITDTDGEHYLKDCTPDKSDGGGVLLHTDKLDVLTHDEVYESLQQFLATACQPHAPDLSGEHEPTVDLDSVPATGKSETEAGGGPLTPTYSTLPSSLLLRLDAARAAGELGGQPRFRAMSVDSSNSEA